MYAEPTKKCTKCGEDLPLSAYHAHSRTSDGRQGWCKKCVLAYRKEYELDNPAISLFRSAKKRAKAKGLPFNLTKEWFDKKLEDGRCEVTGLRFVYGHRHPFRPSPDQIVPGGGYVDGNARMVLLMINTAKQEATDEEFRFYLRQVAEAIVEQG